MPRYRNFYPRSPCGERLFTLQNFIDPLKFLSTLSLRRATCQRELHRQDIIISIHALLAESDVASGSTSFSGLTFLSTLSLRRATDDNRLTINCASISIHALLAESDGYVVGDGGFHKIFLSTLSLRRATLADLQIRVAPNISIHALLAESDQSNCAYLPGCEHFYPRSPCGERPCWCWECQLRYQISIHALLAESDAACVAGLALLPDISIHALLAESDNSVFFVGDVLCTFLSTLSLRRATT